MFSVRRSRQLTTNINIVILGYSFQYINTT